MSDDPSCNQPQFDGTEDGLITCFLRANIFRIQLNANVIDAVMPDHLIGDVLEEYRHSSRVQFRVKIRHCQPPAMPEIIEVHKYILSA